MLECEAIVRTRVHIPQPHHAAAAAAVARQRVDAAG